MFYKKIVLNLICSKFPCVINIYSKNGNLIKNYLVKSYNSRICIFIKECSIKLTAKYNNQTLYKTIFLNNSKCQEKFINLVFHSAFLQRKTNLITLCDARYCLPVLDAVLNFKQTIN